MIVSEIGRVSASAFFRVQVSRQQAFGGRPKRNDENAGSESVPVPLSCSAAFD